MLLLAVICTTVHYWLRYRRLKRIYRADYALSICFKDICRLLPLMPRSDSESYRKKAALLMDSGLRISVEAFHMQKTLLFILGLVFLVSIETTNVFLLYDRIVSDMSIGVPLLEQSEKKSPGSVEAEKELFMCFDKSMPVEEYTLQKLEDREKATLYLYYIESELEDGWNIVGKDAATTAGRIYRKLLKTRTLKKDYFRYATALLAAVFLYFFPDIGAVMKLKLIEDKRDWEILNCIYVFSIFGRLPPFNIRNVLSNMLIASDIYKPLMTEALNSVRNGRGEGSFDAILHKVDNEELYELLEAMKLSMSTGILDMADNIDEMAVNQLRWLDIKSIRRRKTKQVIAMLPVVMIMLLAMIYFSYSLSALSNPMNLIK